MIELFRNKISSHGSTVDLDAKESDHASTARMVDEPSRRNPAPISWMDVISDIDYLGLAGRHVYDHAALHTVTDALVDAWTAAYRVSTPAANLYEFGREPWTFLFDFAGETGAPQWDRTVAAWGLSVLGKRPRDEAYQRGYPSPRGRAERPLDKGHMVPHQVGGDFGPNIFPQDRALNRGWSDDGRRYRTLEREIGASPGRFFFCRLLYTDETDFPTWVELGTLRRGALYVERFRNRFG
jgi:hypothetical protein